LNWVPAEQSAKSVVGGRAGEGEGVKDLFPLGKETEGWLFGYNPVIPSAANAVHVIGLVFPGGQIFGWNIQIGVDAVIDVHKRIKRSEKHLDTSSVPRPPVPVRR